MFVIQLDGHEDVSFVFAYNNTYADVSYVGQKQYAKKWKTEVEASAWAKKYLPGYKYLIVSAW
jgi:hypothetical protein